MSQKSGPRPGKYRIQLAAEPRPFIGVDPGHAPVRPVITDGTDKVWTVRKLPDPDGRYTLTLEEDGRPLYIHKDAGNLVGNHKPPPGTWTIRGVGDGFYTIEVVGDLIPVSAWTVKDPHKPKSMVTLTILRVALPEQKWNFIPILD